MSDGKENRETPPASNFPQPNPDIVKGGVWEVNLPPSASSADTPSPQPSPPPAQDTNATLPTPPSDDNS